MRIVAGNADIWTMEAPSSPTTGGGTNQTFVTSSSFNEIQPNYAPGGNLIAYASDRNGVAQIYAIAPSGGTEPGTRITSSAADDTHPAYSPDGVRLAFAHAGSGIQTTDAQITSGVDAVNDANPDWQPTAPSNTTLPVISGSAAAGGTLFASTGTFAGSASSYAYQWLRCDSAGNNCADISGATSSSYLVVAGDVAKRLRVRVTASGTQRLDAPRPRTPPR